MSNSTLTDHHYNVFGRIMYGYASAETGFKALLSAIVDMNVTAFFAMSSPYSTQDLRNVVKSVAKICTFEHEDEYDKIISLAGEFKRYGKIRNHIAHNTWTKGTRPDSIRPILVDIREGRIKAMGFDDSETDYTLKELVQTANNLFKLNRDIQSFIADYGYSEIIDRNTSDIRKESE